MGSIDVHRVLGNRRIARPRSIATDAGPGDHLARELDDHGWVLLALLNEQVLNVRRGPRLGLERGDALFDALVVDAGDGRGVLEACAAHTHGGLGGHGPDAASALTARRRRGGCGSAG